jgi:hypothetical protein
MLGRSTPPDGSALIADDLHGVQCHSCHKMVDPFSAEGMDLVEPDVPGFGNGMMVLDANDIRRGPYDDAMAPHRTQYSAFHEQGAMCGTCHDVSNPLLADDPVTQPPHAYGVLERTFSEWELSEFSSMGYAGSCQACHMPAVEGRVCFFGPERSFAPRHDFMGANAWIPDVLPIFYPELNGAALAAGKSRAEQSLARAADLSLLVREEGMDLVAEVRVTNLTGHKLPTGYPEGRRMWLHVVAFDTRGDKVYESGAYDATTGILDKDPDIEVFEIKMGLSPSAAAEHGLPAGESFHFILNDTVVKDNRIPPRGFDNAAFANRLMAPVGATYADGQFWSDVEYTLPPSAALVRATLKYQTSSREYVEFLRDENSSNSWGSDLFAAWEATGRSHPVDMAQVSLALPSIHRAGNVNAAVGGTTDVLFVNSDSGDGQRMVFLAPGSPVTVTMDAPPAGPASSSFALYAWRGAPTAATSSPQPRGIGTMVFPTFWSGGSPLPKSTWNNLGHEIVLGTPSFPSSPAPTTVVTHPGLSAVGTAFTLQGFIQDLGSIHGQAAVTNSVIVRVRE